MDKELGQLCGLSGTVLSVHTLAEVEDAGPDGITPAEITNAMTGVVKGELGLEVWESRVPHKASHGVGVEAKHEEEGEMMSVPESLEALSSDSDASCALPFMSSAVSFADSFKSEAFS
jgi:hypothetical protein